MPVAWSKFTLGVRLSFRHRSVFLWNNPPPANSDLDVLTTLYEAERAAGSSVLTNTFGLWFAATTYITFAFSALHVLGDKGPPSPLILYALPYPACAFAGYHMILFGIGLVRSKSIEKIERALMASAPETIMQSWERNPKPSHIGSRAETDWTDFKKAKCSMKFVAAVAYPAPYILATVLVFVCLRAAHQVRTQDWLYIIVVAVYTIIGLGIIWLSARTFLHIADSRLRDLIFGIIKKLLNN